MKKSLLIAATAATAFFISCDLNADNSAVKTKEQLQTPKGKYSYAIGTDMGRVIKQIDADLDHSVVLQGIKDQLDTSKPALMNDSEVTATLQEFMVEMQKARLAKDSIANVERAQKAIENLANQNAFLEKNKTETGIIATESGLQYIILAEGSGAAAKDGDTIVVHYTGTLQDGTKFDSSIDRNQPLSIVLQDGQLIKGWVEVLRLMKKGEKVRAWVPSTLGYGENGNPVIPGNSLLIFEMELLDLKPAK